MRLMPLGGLLAALLVFAPMACGTGPAPRPVDQKEQLSAEATARAAGERTREGQEGLIYASSDDPAESQAEAVQAQRGEEAVLTSTSELRLRFDEEGRLVIDDQPLDLSFEAPEDAEASETTGDATEAMSRTESHDALVAALTEALNGLEPADRLRILITPPPAPQRFDVLFAAIGRVVAEVTVPVEVHVTPAP